MLEGTLESFTLPDIFQLLAFTKKTGCLRLQRDDAEGRVWFRDGDVYYALASTGGLALGKRLVGAGLVTTAQLQRALEDQASQRRGRAGLRLGEILIEDGAVDHDTLEVFIREQIQDAVFDLMRWTTGAFEFSMAGDDATIDEPIQLSASVENLIMEGSRRLEEWDTVRKKIPSSDAIVAMAPRPSEDGVEVSLKPDEWRLLTLVDGRRSVTELVGLYGQGEFQTVKVLYGLVGAGLLEVRDPELEGPPSIAALLEQQELLRQLDGQPPTATGHSDRPSAAGPPVRAVPSPTVDEDEDGQDDEDEEDAVTVDDEPATEHPDRGPRRLRATPSARPEATRRPGQRLTTDPEIDADLVKRLIDGVKEL